MLALTTKQAEILEKMKSLDKNKLVLLCNTADVLCLVQEQEKKENKNQN